MTTQVVTTTFLLRRGTAAAWKENNILLQNGEPGFETDTNRLKIGDGKTRWNKLPYQHEGAVLTRNTHLDFPSVGKSAVIYKAYNEKALYQWNDTLSNYEKLQGNENSDIEIINGGDANGTT